MVEPPACIDLVKHRKPLGLCMSDDFTPEEIKELRSLIPIANQIREEADYRAAKKLVLKTWRTGIIFLSGTIAALLFLRDQLKDFIVGIFG